MIWKWSGLDELRLVHDIEEAHRYSIHQIEFCHKTGLLASCSLDGTAILWDPEVILDLYRLHIYSCLVDIGLLYSFYNSKKLWFS